MCAARLSNTPSRTKSTSPLAASSQYNQVGISASSEQRQCSRGLRVELRVRLTQRQTEITLHAARPLAITRDDKPESSPTSSTHTHTWGSQTSSVSRSARDTTPPVGLFGEAMHTSLTPARLVKARTRATNPARSSSNNGCPRRGTSTTGVLLILAKKLYLQRTQASGSESVPSSVPHSLTH